MLAREDRKALIVGIQASFTETTLNSFLTIDFEGGGLANYASSGSPWPVRLAEFVQRLVLDQKIGGFLRILAEHAGPADGMPGPNPALRGLAQRLLADAWPPPAGRRPCFVAGRHFINRDTLWREVQAFAEGSRGAKRILLVDGEPGTGKSHSSWLVSEWGRERARYVPIDLSRSTAPEAAITELTKPIADRLKRALRQDFDDLAQEARDSLRAGEMLVAALQEVENAPAADGLARPWWILVDGLNLPRVGPPVVDVVTRLAQAIDQGECNNLWLVLIGLKPERLTGSLPDLVRRDRSTLPEPDHVKAWLRCLGEEHSRQLGDPDLAPALATLAPVMNGAGPRDHGFWPPFMAALASARTQLGLDRS